MAVKYVEEYLDTMCNVCSEIKYGLFVEIYDKQICRDCCNNIKKQLAIYKFETEYDRDHN